MIQAPDLRVRPSSHTNGILRSMALILVLAGSGAAPTQADRSDAFEREIEGLRKLLGIPGLQVAVVSDGRVVLERAYGQADVEADEPMTTDHLVEIASVTKTMTAVVVMQLVQEGRISLDDRVVKYPFHRWFYPSRIAPDVRLRHVLSHTSQGPPGETFAYQGNRFGFVLGAFESPEGYGEAVSKRILAPLGMDRTFPRAGVRMTEEQKALLATFYEGFDAATGRPTPGRNQPEPRDFFPSAGFFSNVEDLAKYAVALDDHVLLSGASHVLMESPAVAGDGRVLPYGIGWFTQEFGGERLVWHYGYGDGSSALLLRVPSRNLTLIALANSSEMSASTRLGYGDALDSPFAVAFLKHFVFDRETTRPSPDYGGDIGQVRASLADLHAGGAHPLDFKEAFAQAVIRELASGPGRDSEKAEAILIALHDVRPQILQESGITGLEVLSRFDDPRLNPTTEALGRSLLRPRTPHPAALFYSAQLFEKTGRAEEALALYQRLADSPFEDDGLTLDACLWLGDHLAGRDDDRARDAYWRAVRIGFQSPGYPRAKVDRAIEKLNELDQR